MSRFSNISGSPRASVPTATGEWDTSAADLLDVLDHADLAAVLEMVADRVAAQTPAEAGAASSSWWRRSNQLETGAERGIAASASLIRELASGVRAREAADDDTPVGRAA